MKRSLLVGLALLGGACAHRVPAQNTPKSAQEAAKAAPVLGLAPLAGQKIPVLPASYVVADDSVPGLPADRAAQLRWVDSIIGEQLAMRGPEVTWILPAELRSMAERAPGVVLDPDRMGQALMRNPSLKEAPDQLITNLRPLVAMAGGRYAMIPASVSFTRAFGTANALVHLVMIDVRTGAVLWRSEPTGTGSSAAAALKSTIARILP